MLEGLVSDIVSWSTQRRDGDQFFARSYDASIIESLNRIKFVNGTFGLFHWSTNHACAAEFPDAIQ